jgi:hypothetical protein
MIKPSRLRKGYVGKLSSSPTTSSIDGLDLPRLIQAVPFARPISLAGGGLPNRYVIQLPRMTFLFSVSDLNAIGLKAPALHASVPIHERAESKCLSRRNPDDQRNRP